MQALLARFSAHTFSLFLIVVLAHITACDVTDGVSDENESPRLIFETDVSVTENNGGTIYTATTDVANPTFSLAASGDSTLFAINSSGELSFLTAPQFNLNGNNSYSVQIEITDNTDVLDTLINVTVNVVEFNPAPSIVDATAQTYTENTPITNLSFNNTGGVFLTNCVADTLPNGLQVAVSADASTCEINGTPTTIQAATVHTVTATNATGSSTATISITVVVAAPSLSDAQAQIYTENTPITSLSFVNNAGGLLTNCTADTLPGGLLVSISADSTTCEINGTPTSLQAATIHTITATNDTGNSSASVSISVVVASPLIIDAPAQTFTTDIAIPTLSFTNNGGGALTNCSADTLPPGLQVAISSDGTTCEISGTPTTAQTATIHTVTATNASGNSSATVDVTVNLGLAPPNLTAPSPQTYLTDSAIPTLSFANSGGGSLTDCSADTLPVGLQVTISADTTTCEISGTPTTPQSVTSHTITATNASGTSNASVRITVDLAIPFITQWQTDNPGASNDDQVSISTNSGFTYNYQVDWGDGNTDSNVTGDITHTYASAGTYTIEITGNFPQLFFNPSGNDPRKLLSVEQWGNNPWLSMENAFSGCLNMVINALDTPDLSLVTNTSNMFNRAIAFNQDISNWDVSSVTNMNSMFRGASAFNQPIGGWDVSSVTDMGSMFWQAASFDQDISGWDVSSVTDMSSMFSSSGFNQPIGGWDVSSVTNMNSMFNFSIFEQDIGAWDVSSVTDMSLMFNGASDFNIDISGWDVSSVTNMRRMFTTTPFNQPLNNWDVSSVTDMSEMFRNSNLFNQSLDNWDVSSVTDMSGMFFSASAFNQPIGSWNVSSVTTMISMFSGVSAFDQDISNWDVSGVTSMSSMFSGASGFNQPIGGWDVSSVTDMNNMFHQATAFNQDISAWDVSSVNNMVGMFRFSAFNQDISGWDVSSVTNMVGMFQSTPAFNQPLAGWDVSSVTNMSQMFADADVFNQDISGWNVSSVTAMPQMFMTVSTSGSAFNQDISGWDVSSVTNMTQMFSGALAFDQALGSWNVSSVTNMDRMFDVVTLSTTNYDNLLIGWSGQSLQSNVVFSGGNSNFSIAGASARTILTTTFNWSITDGGPQPSIATN